MERSRGQIILVAALGIAVTLVALALVTNTVIYTENLATRETVDGQGPIALQGSVGSGVGGVLSLANRYDSTDYTTLHDRFVADVGDLSNATGVEAARYGHVAVVGVVNTTNGTRIYQGTARNFTNNTTATDWTLATDVSHTRRFVMNVSRENLSSSEATAFTVTVKRGGTQLWQANLTRNTAVTPSTITLGLGNGSASATCSVAATHAVVDLTTGTLNGTNCGGPTLSSVAGPYNITFQNAHQVKGRYLLFVDDLQSTVDSPDYGTNGPHTAPAIYSATVRLTVRQPDLTYETNVTVAPERSPEGEVYAPA